jgi:Ca-activated chloride channel family protein
VLLTDGVNNSGRISPAAAAEAAKALGVKVYTIAVGVRGDAPVPVKDQYGNTQIVMSKVDVDEDTLQKIADETSGRFYRATDTESLKHIYAEINSLEKSKETIHKFERYQELFAWALIPALGVLGLAVGLEQTRYRRLP